jgi:hypothetical protein
MPFNTPITQHIQRGTLTYIKGDYTPKTVEGWFYKTGITINMRKIGGRNWHQFITAGQILDFQPYQGKK